MRLVNAFLASIVAAGVTVLAAVSLLAIIFQPLSASLLQRIAWSFVVGAGGGTTALVAVSVARRGARGEDRSLLPVRAAALAVLITGGSLALAVLAGWVGAVTGLGVLLMAALVTFALAAVDWAIAPRRGRTPSTRPARE